MLCVPNTATYYALTQSEVSRSNTPMPIIYYSTSNGWGEWSEAVGPGVGEW